MAIADLGRSEARPSAPIRSSHFDVAVAAALMGGGNHLVHTSPSAGVLHLHGQSLSSVFGQASDTGPVTSPALLRRTGGSPSWIGPTPQGLHSPDVPAGIALQVAAGIAFAIRRTGRPGVTAVIQPSSVTATGAWHEGLSFAAATGSPLVVIVAPELHTGRSATPDRAPPAWQAVADSYGTSLEESDPELLPVFGATRRALHRVRSEGRPLLLIPNRDPLAPAEELARLRTAWEGVGIGAAGQPDWPAIEGEARDVVGRAAEAAGV
ncbi:MAG: hypothetical protein J4G12_01410 [Gemmatimonadetes bacterium]|nr:hypothetical protein [Gemmatimonadota bacterium]